MHEGAILTAAFALTQGFSELVPVAQAETGDEGPAGVREDSKSRGREATPIVDAILSDAVGHSSSPC